jgi:DNA invertase Pin-like site-specific DNA recombinase
MDRIYSDKLTGASAVADRPGIGTALAHLRKGDVLVVVGIDRLGRDTAVR